MCACGGEIIEEKLPVEGRHRVVAIVEFCSRCKVVYFFEVRWIKPK